MNAAAQHPHNIHSCVSVDPLSFVAEVVVGTPLCFMLVMMSLVNGTVGDPIHFNNLLAFGKKEDVF